MGYLFEIVFANGAPQPTLVKPSQTEYLYEAAAFAYSLQPLLAVRVVDGACACYCTVGTCIHRCVCVCVCGGVCVCGVCVCVCGVCVWCVCVCVCPSWGRN